ncbi:MAG: hypothetical protein ABI639_08395 [Thermoanaerobaculia bacterium]
MSTLFRRALICLALIAFLAPSSGRTSMNESRSRPSSSPLDRVARDYVDLVLGIGEHDANYVDAFYGPETWRDQVKAQKPDLATLASRADAAIALVMAVPAQAPGPAGSSPDPLPALRRDYLLHQLQSASARIAMLRGKKFSFDAESRALYDAVAPTHDAAFFQTRLDRIDAALRAIEPPGAAGGERPLRDRVEALRTRVTIPRDRIEAVFARAIAECRSRTAARIPLPAGEKFTVEEVTDKPWSAYNWYKGNLTSVIQVNVSLPIWIDRAVDLACHEGYPGHHVYNLLLEQKLVRERGWPEFEVYPLFSPQSLIAEGTANFGIEMAFPGDERLAFERDVLFPLAGLDPALAAPYRQVTALVQELSYAGNEAARKYLDGEIDAAAAAQWIERYGLSSPERATQRVKFIETYRAYVINYNLGQDLVAAYVDRLSAGTAANEMSAKRWQIFTDLISSPRLPGALVAP